MLKSILGALILVGSIPTIGYLAAGQVCFVMGLANMPGYRLWRSGAGQQGASTQRFGVLLGWLGQSAVSLCFAFFLVQLVRLFFRHFEFHALFRWPYWAAVFLLSLGPAYKTLRVSEQSSSDDRMFYRYTLLLTCLTTAVGFILFGVSHLEIL